MEPAMSWYGKIGEERLKHPTFIRIRGVVARTRLGAVWGR